MCLWKALRNKVSVPTTITDVIKEHYRKEGKSSCDAYGNWRVSQGGVGVRISGQKRDGQCLDFFLQRTLKSQLKF